MTLLSITESCNDAQNNLIQNADFGTADFDFKLRGKTCSNVTAARTYTITYRSTDAHGLSTDATTNVVATRKGL